MLKKWFFNRLERFVTEGEKHPRYKFLNRSEIFKNISRDPHRTPAYGFTTQLFLRDLERLPITIKASDVHKKSKFSLIAALIGCDDIASFAGSGMAAWKHVHEKVESSLQKVPEQFFKKLGDLHGAYLGKEEIAKTATDLQFLVEREGAPDELRSWGTSFLSPFLLDLQRFRSAGHFLAQGEKLSYPPGEAQGDSLDVTKRPPKEICEQLKNLHLDAMKSEKAPPLKSVPKSHSNH